jgi:hypothetical protein
MKEYDAKFYGLYEGICAENDDPEGENKIKLQVPQVMGQEMTEWARPCLPVTSNSNHPDHKKHLAAEVAALLLGHGDHSVSISGTTGGGGSPGHTHSFSGTQTLSHTNNHTGNSLSLDHAHETDANTENKWNDDLEITTEFPEHTPHRLVPAVGQKVWVMFIAGDPNFPVWMGVEL